MRGFFLLCLALMLAACVQVLPEAGSSPAQGHPSLRIAFSTVADASDVPTLMALELLRAQGYAVTPVFFAGADLSVAALAQGDAEFANGSTRTHWAAVSQGGDLVTIAQQAANVWVLVARNDILVCADLAGQRVGMTGPGSLNAALLQAFLDTNCPGTTPAVVLLPDSRTRAAALLAGELDATAVELADLLWLEQQAAGRFRRLVDYAAAFPQLMTTGVYVNSKFAAAHPGAVRDYLTALLTIHRTIQAEPARLVAALVRYLEIEEAEAVDLAQVYLDGRVWDPNGGLSREAVAASLDFYTAMGSLEPGLTVDAVADLSYLEAVLAKIGRNLQ